MDPLVGEFVKLGFAGIALAVVSLQYAKVRKEKDLLYEKHAEEVKALVAAHAAAIQTFADRHEAKFDKINEKVTELASRVTGALEAIGRQAERGPRRSIGG